jgi:CheY-like chemotaxis protein
MDVISSSGKGHEVIGIARSGEEAIALAEKSASDVILMDIMLTGAMDGREAAETIRKSNNIPVIFVTAFGDKE